ncbi:MAG TPA: class I SAM-dependent methyltransferase [Patescibacteria group bacterium]
MKCRNCGGPTKEIASFGDQYLSEFNDGKKPSKYPLDMVMCSTCTLVQLKESTPQKELYTENYGYKSGINDTIKANLKEIALRAMKYTILQSDDIVLDIGANDGTLLKFYPYWLTKVACEPIKKLANECRKTVNHVINDFWSLEAWQKEMGNKKAKIITVISCFYDLEDPHKFVHDLTEALTEDGVIIIQQNYLGSMLEQNAFDNIVHEHIEYYSLKSLEYLLDQHDLEIVDVELNDINGGSFRTYIKFINPVERLRRWEKKARLDNWGTYLLFKFRVQNIKLKAVTFINEQIKKGKKIYLYGASTRSGSMLQYMGLDNKQIVAAVERNPEKWGKIMASIGIPIISEEQARKDGADFMIIGPWFFLKEFLEREKDYLIAGGKFIVFLPEFKIIDYEQQLTQQLERG